MSPGGRGVTCSESERIPPPTSAEASPTSALGCAHRGITGLNCSPAMERRQQPWMAWREGGRTLQGGFWISWRNTPALRGLPSTWSKPSPNTSETRGSTPKELANIRSLLTVKCQESFPTDRLPSPPQKIPGPFPNPTEGKQKHPPAPPTHVHWGSFPPGAARREAAST